MQKEYISKFSWNQIFNCLKEQKNIYIKSKSATKLFVEAIFWMAKTGAQWRELPDRYGKWNSVYHRFNEWSKKKIWHLLHTFSIQNPDLEYVMIDSTIIRAHACSAGYKKQEDQGLGRSKGGFTTKIHALADALGNPLKFIITPGQQNDVTQAKELLKDITEAYMLGDKGYDSKEVREFIIQNNCIPVIPFRSNNKNPLEYDKHIYKERHLIECFFSKIKHFRRIFSRFDKSLRNFSSFLSFVGTIIWLR